MHRLEKRMAGHRCSNRYVFCNNQFLPEEQASVPVNDRGFLFGDGAFATLRLCDGRLECYLQHFERLTDHCAFLNILPPKIDLEPVIELVKMNKALEGVWRLKIIVTGGDAEALGMKARPAGQFIISLKPYEGKYQAPCRLGIFPYPLMHALSHVKCLSYAERLFIGEFARQNTFDDAVTLCAEGFVLETAFANIFWRLDGNLHTPDPRLSLLSGIALASVRRAASNLSLGFHYAKARMEEIPGNAQLYICNAMKGICPVTEVSGNVLPRDLDFEAALLKAYESVVAESSLFF